MSCDLELCLRHHLNTTIEKAVKQGKGLLVLAHKILKNKPKDRLAQFLSPFTGVNILARFPFFPGGDIFKNG